ncbi:Putative carboxylesterase, type B, carboxylesterase type B, active, alpha/Beta hydrolase [Colletotrichum destructivum]|uniref:Carboxylic ester hydrolase n=1 Tax=Colletotrichum destructivum TaxID=34406 RepID=A0AAX4HZ69_9PEZI|nr:Putative carboxylesterase, type B, carboxylesterase type B, active, alpha/Beta hydrolase [Colletotrichum destructivum]
MRLKLRDGRCCAVLACFLFTTISCGQAVAAEAAEPPRDEGSSTLPSMKLSTSFPLFAASQVVLAPAAAAAAYNPVELSGYGKFSGTVVNSTLSGRALPAPVDAWLGIDYSTQPVGEGRFKPVSWPAPFNGTKPATRYGKTCVQDPTSTDVSTQDEACLNFNVYRTRGIPLDQKTPVLVWIHGGAFYAGSYRSFDGASFAASSKEPITVVNFHYRINSLGFLPSALFEEEGLLNLGMRDQHFFLKFVQKHIAAFGGDPDAVTIGGRSAGGHSVGILYFHNYDEDEGKPLFARAIHQSGSVTARAFPNATYPLYKKQFEEYMAYIGCPIDEADNAATLACLRAADIDAIRNISTKLYYDYDPALTWPFQPTQGGPLLEKFGSQSGYDETFFKVPVITSTVTDEAKYYMAGDKETNDEFLDYLHNISPALNATDLDLLAALYPDPATHPDSPFANSPNSTQYNRLSAAWSDYGYICPGQETAYRASLAGVPTWKLRFNTNNSWPEWRGIPHTADTKYTWDEPVVQHPDVSHIYHGYLSSFVLSGDPNTHRFPGSPEWPNYEPAGYGLDSEPALQLVVQPNNGTKVEKDDIRREACLYWRDPERAPRLNK